MIVGSGKFLVLYYNSVQGPGFATRSSWGREAILGRPARNSLDGLFMVERERSGIDRILARCYTPILLTTF